MAEAGLEPGLLTQDVFLTSVPAPEITYSQTHSSSIFPWVYPRYQIKVREVGQRGTQESQTTEMHFRPFTVKQEF